MSQASQDVPTFDHYAFNLRDGLRKAAITTLSELEGSINNIGYGWLDDYMDKIMDKQNRAPITEIMKTPSRTQTVKKTRAATTAAKERTDKVKGLNARLALSPSSKQNQTRTALSPLQPRSLNVSTISPIPIASPKAKSVPVRLKPEKEKAKAKPKAKKGKSKKATENDENSPPASANTSGNSNDSSLSTDKSGSISSKSSKEKVEKKSKSTRSKTKKEKEKEDMGETIEQPMQVEDTVANIDNVFQGETPIELDEVDSQPIAETTESVTSILVPATQNLVSIETGKQISASSQNEQQDEEMAVETTPMDVETSMGDKHAAMVPETQRTEDGSKSSRHFPGASQEPDTIPTQAESDRKIDPSMPTSFAVPPVTSTSQPTRQVRSSWLSKALGANAIPLNGVPAGDANAALRKSYAASQRPSTAVDFAGLRKSLVPINGLKRKSDHGMDEEEEEEEVERPEKTIKVDYSDALPARTPASTRPGLPNKTPSFGSAIITSQPSSLNRDVVENDGRSDIHKVTRALDELREKTAAKELAKQKAAFAASTAPRVPQAKSTGTGFLRGLGSIGAGLLGLGGSGAEEEAQRLARELEEERLAELELERLMKEATKPEETAKERGMEVDNQPQIERSTTPDIGSPVQQLPKSPEEEEEEMYKERSVIEELLPEDQRESMDTQRQPSAPAESTTPTGTPTKSTAKEPVPGIQDKDVRHGNQSTSAMQQEEGRVSAAKAKERQVVKAVQNVKEAKKDARRIREIDLDEDDYMEDGEIDEEEEQIENNELTRDLQTHRKNPSASGNAPTPLNMSTSSVAATGSVLSQAQNMAAKALGVKPTTGPIKSVQLAAAAAKKEQAAAERKATLKEAEAKRAAAAAKKAEEERIRADEERIRADEERKAKVAELEEKRRLRAEFEKRQKERAEKVAQAAKEKADKEKAERDAQAAKLRAAEEEAARKRKMAAQTAALNKSQNKTTSKPASTSGLSSSQMGGKGKDPFRPSKQSTATLGSSASHSNLNGMAKMAPSVFRTAETSATTSSTITLVTQNQQQNGERKALGPPSRPSNMQQQPLRQSTHHATTLQQSRVALQSQLDEKAAMIQSEDIVLPDIASEYSDSDDEDRTKDFIPPTWAESPQLRAALEAQASRNPDELFGPIKPLNMEELFKVRTGKFRARTSSANWSKTGDGLTKAEEVEYAKRMGFKAIPSNLSNGQ
uniref:Inner centromere protein ARK-binding domain-containing protein n=1 Tax=Kwoniella pini CBS 10737 TaxID=1296096 RepID=A0A1B9I8C3_9TREE|nr:uncharacterized protein I206_02516 [Kwoniella pini CBS 10737]OCF51800.1 hypothetical protein I206_02516 [Kwoniella pini CBS 10737]